MALSMKLEVRETFFTPDSSLHNNVAWNGHRHLQNSWIPFIAPRTVADSLRQSGISLNLFWIPPQFLDAGFLCSVFLLQLFARASSFEEPVGLRHERPGYGGPGDHRAGLRGSINGSPREVSHRLRALVSRGHAGKGEISRDKYRFSQKTAVVFCMVQSEVRWRTHGSIGRTLAYLPEVSSCAKLSALVQ